MSMQLKFRTKRRPTWKNITIRSKRNGRPWQVRTLSERQRFPLIFTSCNMSEHPRIAIRITEGEAKRNKRDNLEFLLARKISSVRYPMQELELNYPTTKGKVYSEEEDRYLLCRLFHYGMQADDVYERIKKDITEFPVFRFDWFFKSRSPQELQRRCNTLLGMIEKEAETKQQEEMKAKGAAKGKVRMLRILSILLICAYGLGFAETWHRGGTESGQEGIASVHADWRCSIRGEASI